MNMLMRRLVSTSHELGHTHIQDARTCVPASNLQYLISWTLAVLQLHVETPK